MSELPAGWYSAAIRDIAEVRLGRQRSPDRATGPHMRPYMRAANVSWAGINLADVKEMDFTPKEFEVFGLRPGDVLVGEASGSRLEVGKSAVWRGEIVGACFQNTLIRLRVSDAVTPEYLQKHLTHDALRGALAGISRGIGIHHLGAAGLAEWEIALAPIVEQRRIADKLDAVLARADACRERLDRVPALLKKFREAVLEAAVSGRLTEEWRGRADLTGWTVERAVDVCEKVQSGGTPKEGFQDDAGIPFLKVYNIVNQKVNFEYRPQFIADTVHRGSMSKSRTRSGDVLMNIVGPPLGKVAVVPDSYPEWNVNQAITLFRPGPRISSDWLYVLLCGGANIRDIIHATRGIVGQANISLTQCRDFEFPVPPAAEQQEIVRRVGELFALADGMEAKYWAAVERVEKLTPAVLAKAFRGELVSQDPNDEPAEALLERIRAERESSVSKPAAAKKAGARRAAPRKNSGGRRSRAS